MGEEKKKIIDFKVIWYFFRAYKARLLLLLALIGLTGMLETLNVAALYPVINYGLDLPSNNPSLQWYAKVLNFIGGENQFRMACILLIGISMISVSFKFLYQYASNKLLTRIVGDTQMKIMKQFLHADYDFYVRNQQGKLIHTGTVAPDDASNLVLFVIRLLYDSTNAILLFSLLLVLSWQGTVFLIAIGVVYALGVKKIMERLIYRCADIANQEDRKKNVILNELITGFKSIKIFHTFHEWQERYVDSVEKSLHNKFKMMMGRVFPDSFMKFMFFAVPASIGIAISQRPQTEMIELLPVFGTFVIVAAKFFPSVQLVGNALMVITNSMPKSQIVYDLCHEEVRTIEEGDKKLSEFTNEIQFENVWFKYPKMSDYLLKGASFSIKKNEVTALVGPSGSGKTTIINLLLKLYQPERGDVALDGESIFNFDNKSYLKKVGYVSQETFIYNTSIEENIRFGLEHCTKEMVIEAAKQANAHEFILETKSGYETIVGDAGMKLSGGQKQRVAIARAILRKPEIIVLDEATSSLDNISEKKVQAAINNISKHTTIFVIAHRLSTIQNADKIMILGDGQIVEQGTHEDLLKNQSLYYQIYNAKDVYQLQ